MRSKSIILIILSSFLLALPLRAQEPVDAAINAKIRDGGLNRSQVHKTFTHFTEVIGPRLTAFRGMQKCPVQQDVESCSKESHNLSKQFIAADSFRSLFEKKDRSD